MALVAFLFVTFAPSAAPAFLQRASSPIWMQICTMDGLVSMEMEADSGKADGNPAASPTGHCLLCFQPATPPANGTPTVASLPVLGGDPPPLFYRAPYPLFVWAAAQPRAPPLAA